MEEDAVLLAESYSYTFTNASSARELINDLLVDRLEVASSSALLNQDQMSDEVLSELAEHYSVDVIYIYNHDAVVTHSSTGGYIGWRAPSNHPVTDYLESGADSLVEEIRPDTDSGVPYKFAYYQLDDETFSQIGIEADVVTEFLQAFELENMLEDIHLSEQIVDAAFFSQEGILSVAGSPGFVSKGIHEKEFSSIDQVQTDFIETQGGEDVFRIYIPIIRDDDVKLGTLGVVQSTERAVEIQDEIVFSGVAVYISILLIVGLLIMNGYFKTKNYQRLLYYDPLTKLPNYVYMQKFMKDKLAASGESHMVVFMINCRHFGAINLSHGFEYGDGLLQIMGESLKKNKRKSDMLFRFNADRFLLYIDNPQDAGSLEAYAEHLLDAMDQLVMSNINISSMHSNIGIVETHYELLTLDMLTKRGSITLNQLEEKDHERILFFGDEMENLIQREEQIEQEINAVINHKNAAQFHLAFQPQMELVSGKISGFEALARLTSATYGPVSPLEFIDIAEKKHLIVELGYTIIDLACQFVKNLDEENMSDLRVAVNVSGIQLLRKDFTGRFIELCHKHGVGPDSFEIEVTESVLFDQDEDMKYHLNQLRQAGVTVSLDDFGTGYSSFSRLQEFPMDRVKIDRSFTNRICGDPEEEPILSDLISMCHKMGMSVVTEGVEEDYQMNYLLDQECDFVQGYYFSKPLKSKDALNFAKENLNK